MKSKFRFISLIIVSIFLSNCSPKVTSPEAQLSNQLTSSVLWYRQSAEMVASYLQAYHYAQILVGNKLDTLNSALPPAVVLDIDETVLDNSPYEVKLIQEGKLYESETWKQWTDAVKAEALPGAKEFIDFAKAEGVEVFYISNRKEHELESTIQNLQVLNFPNADQNHVLLRNDGSDKTDRRARVSGDYNIILFIGDNLTDFSELFAQRDKRLGKDLVIKNKEELFRNFVILPNPMYGEWENALYNNDYGISNEMKIKKRQEALKK